MSIQETLTKHLIGRRITTVDGGTLTLDDGTTLRLYESTYACCAGASGEWKILDPDRLEAAITHVEFESDGYKDFYTRVTTCRITILHKQNPIALGDGHAHSGNDGSYFSALSLEITVDGTIVHDEEVISA
ncbi:hypothetical protein CJ204_00900 [Corynebacterium xerosis]|uniref:DUF7448 domain-containing protein n=1 Tax=Corynebacterium xerosis TaxID=1725 RepID=A0A2N6T254_9CORY|nr:hypothetical protein [Corynebacterium xerosis]PMC63410.1 hypothetical protein CJ204_00900 [Corynebacterium xerosis]